ncbi:hypothetical protein, partial [Roseobacter sp.]|uniref:hypothetical protein n=1 Tax=Roseobacter sp. TaxID=1907202 RepID=UPI0025F1BA0A
MSMPAHSKQRLAMFFCTVVCPVGIAALITSRPCDAALPEAQHPAVERATEFSRGAMRCSDVKDLAVASGLDAKILVGKAAAPRAHPSLVICQVDAQAAGDAG